MDNLSSSRESIEEKKEMLDIVNNIEEKGEINLQPIIEQCNTFLASIEETYNVRSIKELHDAIIHVTSAKRCLDNINLN